MKRDIVDELELLVHSRYGLIFLETIEEDRTEQILNRLSRRMNIPLFIWTLNKGLYRSDADNAIYGTGDVLQVLSHIGASNLRALYHFQGFIPFFKDIGVISGLKNSLKHVHFIRRGLSKFRLCGNGPKKGLFWPTDNMFYSEWRVQ